MLGFAVVASPVLMASTGPAAERRGVAERVALLLCREATSSATGWQRTASPRATGANVKQGLSTFNFGEEDHGWTYYNPEHGFVDPLTGVLLWIGVAVTAVRFWRRRESGDLLFLVGFLTLYLSFAFLVSPKRRTTRRWIVVVPFVAYLAVQAIRFLASAPGVSPRVAAGHHPARGRRHRRASCSWPPSAPGTSRMPGTTSSWAGRTATTSAALGATPRTTRRVAGQKFYVAASDERPYSFVGLRGRVAQSGCRSHTRRGPVDVVDPATLGAASAHRAAAGALPERRGGGRARPCAHAALPHRPVGEGHAARVAHGLHRPGYLVRALLHAGVVRARLLRALGQAGPAAPLPRLQGLDPGAPRIVRSACAFATSRPGRC